ncbi:hypothetical protein [Streptomyces albipurpureus]|uniref:Uncharacterized protein n=1 Tax=Streptomyces albipurpureus TaxID=2897419 RepID=A0ABT0UUV4_9ACTN|nr:hypothetical protein [Streptomyces sp. CWNU-1]MCM2390971.1 hypothetical protein [Streptomyces sp. CWNU-1]
MPRIGLPVGVEEKCAHRSKRESQHYAREPQVPKQKVTAKRRRRAAWESLNQRQQMFLEITYHLDQQAEAIHRAAGASMNFDRRPASEWRRIDFGHDPGNRELYGLTEMQQRLERAGLHNKGNGSTLTVLENRRLIVRSIRPTTFGVMVTVKLTFEGRAVYRAGNNIGPVTSKSTVELTDRSWEVLAKLWVQDQQEKALTWGYSTTIEHVLINRHNLAERVFGGYRLTESGQTYYRRHWSEYASAYPEVKAPHPDGLLAWPEAVDIELRRAGLRYDRFAEAWTRTVSLRDGVTEATLLSSSTEPSDAESELASLAAEWCSFDADTAVRRARLADAHLAKLENLARTAAWTYASLAGAAFAAAVDRTPPQDALSQATQECSEMPVLPVTALDYIDTAVAALRAAVTGEPPPGQGPRKLPACEPRAAVDTSKPPGGEMVAYAGFLRRQIAGGTLQRKLHAESLPSPN